MSEMFNRYAIGVRAHADGVGVKQANVSSVAVRGIKKRQKLGEHRRASGLPRSTGAVTPQGILNHVISQGLQDVSDRQ